jgi:GNAT superfamily N-acetyltransferase
VGDLVIRAGGAADDAILLGMFDDAVAWLAERGRTAQWGSEPWSTNPRRAARVREMAAKGTMYIAELDRTPVGALILGERLDYAPPVDEPEVYINILLSSPAHRGAGIGSALLEFARDQTRRQRISLLRVDCWSGGDRKLVAYYEGQGFTRSVEVTVGDVTAQVFEQRL